MEFALEYEALTSRELAVKYTDENRYFVSESLVYRILKAADLITAPDLYRRNSSGSALLATGVIQPAKRPKMI